MTQFSSVLSSRAPVNLAPDLYQNQAPFPVPRSQFAVSSSAQLINRPVAPPNLEVSEGDGAIQHHGVHSVFGHGLEAFEALRNENMEMRQELNVLKEQQDCQGLDIKTANHGISTMNEKLDKLLEWSSNIGSSHSNRTGKTSDTPALLHDTFFATIMLRKERKSSGKESQK